MGCSLSRIRCWALPFSWAFLFHPMHFPACYVMALCRHFPDRLRSCHPPGRWLTKRAWGLLPRICPPQQWPMFRLAVYTRIAANSWAGPKRAFSLLNTPPDRWTDTDGPRALHGTKDSRHRICISFVDVVPFYIPHVLALGSIIHEPRPFEASGRISSSFA